MRLHCEFSTPVARSDLDDYIRHLEISVGCCDEDGLNEYIVGKLAVDQILWMDALVDGVSLFEICDSDSQGLHEVHTILTKAREVGHAGMEAVRGSQPMTSVEPGRYRHYKGKEYTVLGVVLHSETQEELVVYQQEYGEHGLWVRPKQMFLDTVTVDGRVVPRFQRITGLE